MAYEEEKGAEFVDRIAATLNQRASKPHLQYVFAFHTSYSFLLHTYSFLPTPLMHHREAHPHTLRLYRYVSAYTSKSSTLNFCFPAKHIVASCFDIPSP